MNIYKAKYNINNKKISFSDIRFFNVIAVYLANLGFFYTIIFIFSN